MTHSTQRERVQHSFEVLESPLFVAVREGADIEVAWARFDQPHSHTALGYRPVRGSEVEQLPIGTQTPEKKDIGVYGPVDTKADTFRMGEMILMQISRTAREARIKRENDRALSLRPKKSDAAETAEEKTETSTIKKEIGTTES